MVVIGIIVLLLPLFIPTFVSSLVTKMMIYGLFATSLNLIWGYAEHPQLRPRRLLRGRRVHRRHHGDQGRASPTSGWVWCWPSSPPPIVAAILGIPAFRVFGVGAGAVNPIYFLLATIAFGELLSRLAITFRPVTGGQHRVSPASRSPTSGFGHQGERHGSTTTWCSSSASSASS